MPTRYSEEFKEQALSKVVQRGDKSIQSITDEMNVNVYFARLYLRILWQCYFIRKQGAKKRRIASYVTIFATQLAGKKASQKTAYVATRSIFTLKGWLKQTRSHSMTTTMKQQRPKDRTREQRFEALLASAGLEGGNTQCLLP